MLGVNLEIIGRYNAFVNLRQSNVINIKSFMSFKGFNFIIITLSIKLTREEKWIALTRVLSYLFVMYLLIGLQLMFLVVI